MTCILEDGHRNHEISSISQAAEKEKNLILKASELCGIIADKLHHMKTEIADGKKLLLETAEKQRVDITDLFNEIRKKLNTRETNLKQKVTEQLMKEEMSLKT